MGATLTTLLFLLALFAAMERGLATMAKLTASAQVFARQWHGEYVLRQCMLTAAATHNLRDGVHYLVDQAPQQRTVLEQASGELEDELTRHLPESGVRPDATGACHAPGHLELAATSHLEVNPSIPSGWPNWVARFVAPTAP